MDARCSLATSYICTFTLVNKSVMADRAIADFPLQSSKP